SKKFFVIFTDTNNESGSSSESNAKKVVEGLNISTGFDSDDIPQDVFDAFVNSILNDLVGYVPTKLL
ncbi:MAG: hypothetical protein MUO77_03195, partial [Anaerolineales bacterium]|nr:hypothetical protein [Anaerolineales bacterium]